LNPHYRQSGKVTILNSVLTIVESAQIVRESMRKEVTSLLDAIKSETLFNLTLESPLLRDAEITDDTSISKAWRGSRFVSVY
jgi:hypothetical protein